MTMTHQDKVIYNKMKALKNNLDNFNTCNKCDKQDNFITFTSNKKEDRVNHPSHYTWLKEKCGIEVIDITRHLDFNLGNAIKYILRAGHKSEDGYSKNDKFIEDLEKAIFYIKDEINLLK